MDGYGTPKLCAFEISVHYSRFCRRDPFNCLNAWCLNSSLPLYSLFILCGRPMFNYLSILSPYSLLSFLARIYRICLFSIPRPSSLIPTDPRRRFIIVGWAMFTCSHLTFMAYYRSAYAAIKTTVMWNTIRICVFNSWHSPSSFQGHIMDSCISVFHIRIMIIAAMENMNTITIW